ncbi:MAG: hypothetical protein DHS20C02_08400 [Micavibrio sp.]|nr:MAG: hypothetical protein DHS20C02_08400 [Micavibrio sp.]
MTLNDVFNTIAAQWKSFKEKHIIAPYSEKLDDVDNYGIVADRIAAKTGYHPADVKLALDKMKSAGIDVSESAIPDLIERFKGGQDNNFIYIKE